jgi:hypothetical protein
MLGLVSLPCVYHPCFTVGLGVRPDQIGRTSLPRYVFPTRPVGPVRTTTADRVELLTSDQTGHQANQPHNNTPLTSRLHVTREDTPNQISSSRSFASFCPHDTWSYYQFILNRHFTHMSSYSVWNLTYHYFSKFSYKSILNS